MRPVARAAGLFLHAPGTEPRSFTDLSAPAPKAAKHSAGTVTLKIPSLIQILMHKKRSSHARNIPRASANEERFGETFIPLPRKRTEADHP
jgi:hypothetical protein